MTQGKMCIWRILEEKVTSSGHTFGSVAHPPSPNLASKLQHKHMGTLSTFFCVGLFEDASVNTKRYTFKLLSCPHQASLQIWRSKMGGNSHCSPDLK